MSKVITIISLALVALVSFTATAFASESSESIMDLAKPVYDAFVDGQPMLAAALALVLAVALARKYLAPRWKFLATDAGGALLVLLGAMGSAFAAALAGGASLSLALTWQALGVAVTAAGGYTLIKRLIINPLQGKGPAWLRAALRVLTWIFDDRSAKAAEAGDKAVAANPATGITGVVGNHTDVP